MVVVVVIVVVVLVAKGPGEGGYISESDWKRGLLNPEE